MLLRPGIGSLIHFPVAPCILRLPDPRERVAAMRHTHILGVLAPRVFLRFLQELLRLFRELPVQGRESDLAHHEFLEIKEHTVKGYEILKEIDEMYINQKTVYLEIDENPYYI